MPSIINQAPAQAVIVLSQVGLRLGMTKGEHTAEVESGLIIQSVPSAGTLVEPHSQISIVVSLGCLCSRPPPVTPTRPQPIPWPAGLGPSPLGSP